MKSLNEIIEDLSFLENYEVVIFGSYVYGKTDKRSDVDIAVITREENRDKCIEIWKEILGKVSDTFDIKIFELLPLHIKASVIQNYEVVYGNRLDISEYFYKFRKLWNDSRQRFSDNQFKSAKEKIRSLERFGVSQRRKKLTFNG